MDSKYVLPVYVWLLWPHKMPSRPVICPPLFENI